jgi:hypothetical protein
VREDDGEVEIIRERQVEEAPFRVIMKTPPGTGQGGVLL